MKVSGFRRRCCSASRTGLNWKKLLRQLSAKRATHLYVPLVCRSCIFARVHLVILEALAFLGRTSYAGRVIAGSNKGDGNGNPSGGYSQQGSTWYLKGTRHCMLKCRACGGT